MGREEKQDLGPSLGNLPLPWKELRDSLQDAFPSPGSLCFARDRGRFVIRPLGSLCPLTWGDVCGGEVACSPVRSQ